MAKYYYTDPLAAAWMAKHFGMKIYWISNGYEIQDYGWESIIPMDYDCVDGRRSEDKYYIHPDSLHLLEPETGDVYEVDQSEVRYIDRDGVERITKKSSPYADFMRVPSSGRTNGVFLRIIQRNGIPFHWPKCDEE